MPRKRSHIQEADEDTSAAQPSDAEPAENATEKDDDPPAPPKKQKASRARKKTTKKRRKAPRAKKRRTRMEEPEPKTDAPGPAEQTPETGALLSADEPVELSPGEALELFSRLTTRDAPAGPAPETEVPSFAETSLSAETYFSREAPSEEPGVEAVEEEADLPAATETDAPAAAAAPECAEEPARSLATGAHLPQPCGQKTRVLSSILEASCRVLTYESADVEAGMRVAGSTLARLYGLVRECGLGVSLGPICQTRDRFVAEWDNTPAEMPVVVLANLSCAQEFLPAVVAERPGVAAAYWIVFETLRGDVSTATNDFLAELRAQNRLRAIGFGPRNVLEAVRRGSEAVRGHVEWGFGKGPSAKAG